MVDKNSELTNKTLFAELLKQSNIISNQVNQNELMIILEHAERQICTHPAASLVEFGCYMGTTSLFLQRLLVAYNRSAKQLHVYDSFQGLPNKSAQDASPVGGAFSAGKLSASKREFIINFKKAGIPLPAIHKKWFDQLEAVDVPNDISFAFLDGDYYLSILDSLRLIENKLVKGAVVIVDDYQSEQLPGAKKAVTEWLKGKPYKLLHHASLAIIS